VVEEQAEGLVAAGRQGGSALEWEPDIHAPQLRFMQGLVDAIRLFGEAIRGAQNPLICQIARFPAP
jgi:hypothetical protein